ncbi:MAG: hypothetical protein R3276_02645 [Marinobacter sp.]|nr:hypothetical protein [Marinobacter sp.]
MRLSSRLQLSLSAIALTLSAQAAAENIDMLMTDLFPKTEATYIGYDSVERLDIPESAPIDRKYLIVDFRFQNPVASDQLQASIHKVCMALLKDRDLIQSLSSDGYDMVSVAFDRQSQFDCL